MQLRAHASGDSLLWGPMGCEDDTSELARFLASFLKPGDSVALHGVMGSGKTTLVRYLSAELGCTSEAVSPTFALQRIIPLTPLQPSGIRQLVHYDLYRIDDPRELTSMGFGMEDEDAIVIVEWPERCPGLWERSNVKLHIFQTGQGERWVRLWGPKDRLSGTRHQKTDGNSRN
jgi:tRNA threonylcarbamoyl adenosine modification protein YjeE